MKTNTNSKMYKKVKSERKTVLPLRFRDETDSDMLRRLRQARVWKSLYAPYDPLSLQEDYYFGRANQRLTP